ncbi:MBL fold hydrolase [Halobacteriales archaeon QS_9_68_42]|nr:MAG: MBL fold hydrolase [Halobacteriales archaeon QS_9_68_42]
MLTELRDDVWWYECKGVNAYLLADDDGLTVVDTGTPFDAARVEGAVDAAGYDPEVVSRVLLTHYDFDHVGSAAKLDIDAPIYAGREDADLVTGERRPRLSGAKPLLQFALGPLVPDVPAGRIRRVDDGDEIGGFTAYHTPGHTPGHTAYVHEERGVAFLGDLVAERDGRLRPSPWFISYDVGRVRASIKDLSGRVPAFEAVCMGHGTPFKRDGGARLEELAESI